MMQSNRHPNKDDRDRMLEAIRTMITNANYMGPTDHDEDDPTTTKDEELPSNNGPFLLEELVIVMEWSDKDGDRWVNRAHFSNTPASRVKGLLHMGLNELP